MKYNEYVQDFLDGTLEGAKEEQFFLALSSSDELRRELKQQIAIKDAVKADTKAFSPKAASTAAIFSSLGFDPPGAAPPPKPAFWEKTGAFLKTYSQAFYGGLTAAAATIAVMLLLFDTFGGGTDSSNISSEKTTGSGNDNYSQNYLYSYQKPVTAGIENSEIPVVSSGEKPDDGNTAGEKIKTVVKYVYLKSDGNQSNADISKSASDFANHPASNENFHADDNILFKDLNASKNTSFPAGFGQTAPGFSRDVPQLSLSPFRTNGRLGFSVELRGSQYWFSAEEKIQPDKYQAFNNLSAAAYYEIFEEFIVGLEYRRENFYQKYEAIDENMHLHLYEQQPNFSSYSAVMRYLPKYAKVSSVQPFAQVSFGGNSAGPVGRAMLGAEIMPYNNIAFTVGMEASIMSYHHRSYNFYSSKYGMNFGVRIKM